MVSPWNFLPSSRNRKWHRVATTTRSSLLKVLYHISVSVSFLLKKESGCHSPQGVLC